MSGGGTIPIAGLLHNIEGGFFDIARRYLQRPEMLLWPQFEEEINAVLTRIAACLPPSTAELAALSAAASLLFRFPARSGARSIAGKLCRRIDTAGAIPEQDIRLSDWFPVPVAVEQGQDRFRLITIALAVSRSPGDKFSSGFAEDARAAVRAGLDSARELAGKKQSFSCFPLVEPDRSIIRHRSLALPLAIQALAMLSGQAKPESCLATGGLSKKNGLRILAVGGVEKKARCADREGFALFLYPQANDPTGDMPMAIAHIAVRDLEEAWMWAILHAPGRETMLHRLAMAMRTPHDFLVHCTTFPAYILTWLGQQEHFQPVLREILSTPRLADELADQLCVCVRDENYSYRRAEALAAMVTTENDIREMGKASVLAALSWCGERIGLANHRGDVEAAERWFSLCEEFRSRALRRRPDGPILYSRIINRFFGVGKRHSRYEFRPELEPPFARFLEQQLQQYQDACLQFGPCTDYALGALLGTKAQNYGFCGPEFFQDTKKTVALAQQCFGNGEDEELYYHWQRQFNYLLFALLDLLPDVSAATVLQTLGQYTGIFLHQGCPDGLPEDRFHLFALVRTTADLAEKLPETVVARLCDQVTATCLSLPVPQCSADIHPWQLICHNTGRLNRLLGNREEAAACRRRSVDLCMQGEAALQAMALLPLAAIYGDPGQSGRQDFLQVAEKIVGWVLPRLYKPHFAPLLNAADTQEALALINDNPGRFFPFTYR